MATGNKRQAKDRLAQFPVDFPTGVLQDFAGTSAPDGWLLCDGSEVSRTEYAALFAVIGTTYGVGDGSTTFNLPDERGQFRRGLDDMGTAQGAAGVDVDGTARTVGQSQSDAMQGHYHSLRFEGVSSNVSNSGTASTMTQSVGNGASVNMDSDNQARSVVTDGVNGSPRTSGETRPMNHAYYVIIKA